MGFLEPEVIANTELFTSPGATLFHFGVLSSAMHMAWVRQVCGRLKSDYRYSNRLVYNNFPWPEDATDRQQQVVANKAQAILEGRTRFKGATLADLYDPLAMPPALVEAHRQLDRAVDACYRAQPFQNDRLRLEFLFDLYERLNAPVIPASKQPRGASATSRRSPSLD